MKNGGVEVSAQKIYKRKLFVKIAKITFLLLLILISVIYLFLYIVYAGGRFTVTLDKNLSNRKNIFLTEDGNVKNKTRRLSADTIDYMVNKVLNLRIYDDSNGVMNKSILDVGGSILSISQFTLYADSKKGNRPSYINALNGEKAISLYEEFNNKLSRYICVETGKFGADMLVDIKNDGPVTIMLERE